jgi:hypothetical protein
MKCIACGKRKGKRFCPSKNSHICAQCCGEKRVIEINCPADCVYLTSGQSYQWVKKIATRSQHSDDPLLQKKLNETRQVFIEVLFEMEAAIVKYAAGLRSLKDEHILEAVTLLMDTYQTEQKGLIYEHTSPNPLVQSLFRDLRVCLEEMRSGQNRDFPPLRSSDLLDCLKVLENDIQCLLQAPAEADDYLRFIRRNHPEMAAEASAAGRLILPG